MYVCVCVCLYMYLSTYIMNEEEEVRIYGCFSMDEEASVSVCLFICLSVCLKEEASQYSTHLEGCQLPP